MVTLAGEVAGSSLQDQLVISGWPVLSDLSGPTPAVPVWSSLRAGRQEEAGARPSTWGGGGSKFILQCNEARLLLYLNDQAY